MLYTVDIVIDLPRDRVVELFADPDNTPKWQAGLLKSELISGNRGEVGAKTKLVFQMGKRQMEMVETITKRDIPTELDGTYETTGVFNIVRNRFIEISPNQTRLESENEFRFSSFFMKLMGVVMKGAFPKQSLKYLQDFKAFAEDGVDVRDKKKVG